ncbi:MAG: cache domain-containing protein [Verrucomicrobia bacterium]|nr:cache domain-containing protein [Verrucomicrobiota bacterium]
MKITSSQARSLKRQGLTILILLLAFGAYYAVIVPRQTAYFTNRSFRLLAEMSDYIRSEVEQLFTVLDNAVRHAPKDLSGKAGTPPASVDTASQIRAVLALAPNLTVQEVSTRAAADRAELNLKIHPAGRASWLELSYTTTNYGGLRVNARSDLERLFEPIMERRLFDDVLLLETNGQVVFQLSPSALRVATLEVPSGRSFETNLVGQAGADYKLFAQPVSIAFTSSHGGAQLSPTQWTLCGVMKADRFRVQTLAVDYTLAVEFVFLALLLIFTWPFLNAWSLGLRSGLRKAEVALLAVGIVFMNALLTLQVLDLYAYARLEDRLDEQLEGFAREIKAHFKSELQAVSRQLDLMTERYERLGQAGKQAGIRTNETDILTDPALVALNDSAPDPHPFFRMVFWTRRDGSQVAKWTVKSNNTPFINVARRGYFRTLADGRPWVMRTDHRSVPFCLEPIYTVTTGENLAVFATAPANDAEKLAMIELPLLSLVKPVVPAGFGYCVIDAEGKALFHADETRNLRENFFEECNHDHRLRAAVLGRSSDRFDAQYLRRAHSIFVTPLEDLPWSLAVFREEQVLQTSRIQIATVVCQLFLFYALGLVLALGAVFVVMRLKGSDRQTAWLWPDDRHGTTYRALAGVNFVLALAFASLVFLMPRGWGLLVLALLLPVSGFLMTAWALNTGWEGGPGKLRALLERLLPTWRWGYVMAAGWLLVMVAILPVLVFFKVAFTNETGLLVKQAQLGLAKDLQARRERIWTELNSPKDGDRPGSDSWDVSKFFERRLTNTWDVYSTPFFNTTFEISTQCVCHATTRPSRDAFNAFLAALRPHFTEFDVQTRGLMPDASSDAAWTWTRSRSGLALCKPGLYGPGNDTMVSLHVRSKPPGLPDFEFLSFLWVPPFLLLLAVPFGVIYVVGRKVLLLEAEPFSESGNAPRRAGCHLVLGPPRIGKSRFLNDEHFDALKPGMFRRIDLRHAEDRKWLEPPELEKLLQETDKAVAVDHFEYGQDDPKLTRVKLRFLQELLHDEYRAVVVVSNVHPLHLRMEPSEGGGDSKASVIPPQEQWTQVLAAFKKIHLGEAELASLGTPVAGETATFVRSHYLPLWNTCSPAEQGLLYQVAQGQLIHSAQPELRALLSRRVLKRDPRLRLACEGLRRFILAHHTPDPIALAPAAEQGGVWNALKGPAATVLILSAGFFFWTQPEVWNKSVGLATAFVTGLGALVKVFDLLQKSSAKKTPTEA